MSPPTSPGHGGGDGGGPYGGAVGEGSVDGGHSSHGTSDSGHFQGLKIISPSDINSGQHKKREMLEEGGKSFQIPGSLALGDTQIS